MHLPSMLMMAAVLLSSMALAVEIPTSGHPSPGLIVMEPNPCADPTSYLYYSCMGNNIGCCKSTPACSSDEAFCPAEDSGRWVAMSSDEKMLVPVTVGGAAFWSPLASTAQSSTLTLFRTLPDPSQSIASFTIPTAPVQSWLPTLVSTRTPFSSQPTASKTSATIPRITSTVTTRPSTIQPTSTFATVTMPSATSATPSTTSATPSTTSATPSTTPTSTVVLDSCKIGFEKGCTNFGATLAVFLLVVGVITVVILGFIYGRHRLCRRRNKKQLSMQKWASSAALVDTPDTSTASSEIPSTDNASYTSSNRTGRIWITVGNLFLREGHVFPPSSESTVY